MIVALLILCVLLAQVILTDRYYLSAAAYAPLDGDARFERRRILEDQAARFRRPDLWVRVLTPTSLCRERVLERGEAGEEAFKALARRIEFLWRDLEEPRLTVAGYGAVGDQGAYDVIDAILTQLKETS